MSPTATHTSPKRRQGTAQNPRWRFGLVWLALAGVLCAGCNSATSVESTAGAAEPAKPSPALIAPAPVGAATPAGAPPAANDARPAPVHESLNVVYVKRGDLELKGDIFVPDGDGPFPGVLMVHGGAWQRGSKGRFAPAAKELAGHGYTVMSIDYRLAPQFKFPAQLDDCRDAVRYMRREAARHKIDPARVAGCGYSAGGHLVCLLAAEDPAVPDPADAGPQISTRLQAVAAGGVPSDFRQFDPDSTFLAYWLGGTPRECPDKYRAASPRAFVSPDDPPMFLYHGEKDWLVPVLSAEAMVETLHESKVPAELFVVPGAGHRQTQFDRRAMTAAREFLDKTLKPAK